MLAFLGLTLFRGDETPLIACGYPDALRPVGEFLGVHTSGGRGAQHEIESAIGA